MSRFARSWWQLGWLALIAVAAFVYLQNSYTYGYALKPLTLAIAVAVAVVGLDLLFGAGHQLNLGQGFFFGLGAYGVAILSGELELPSLLAAVLAVVLTGLLAWPLGRVLLRLEGFYFAVATLGLSIIGVTVVLALRSVTGGDDGLVVAPLEVGGTSFVTTESRFWLVATVAIVMLVLAGNFIRSRHGLTVRVVGVDETAAVAQGIDVARVKTQLFVISAVYAGVGGVLYALASGFISPAAVGATTSIQMLVAVMLGGMGTILGPALAVIVLRLLSVFFEVLENYLDIIYGAALVVLLMVPLDRLARFRRKPAPSATMPKEPVDDAAH